MEKGGKSNNWATLVCGGTLLVSVLAVLAANMAQRSCVHCGEEFAIESCNCVKSQSVKSWSGVTLQF